MTRRFAAVLALITAALVALGSSFSTDVSAVKGPTTVTAWVGPTGTNWVGPTGVGE